MICVFLILEVLLFLFLQMLQITQKPAQCHTKIHKSQHNVTGLGVSKAPQKLKINKQRK